MNPISAEIRIGIIEKDSSLRVPTKIFDEDGSNERDNPDYDKQVSEVSGMTYFRIGLMHEGQQRALESPNARPEKRRQVLRASMEFAVKSIVARLLERKGIWWCEPHKREATSRNRNGKRCCDPSLNGIMIPCHVTFKADEK